MAHQALMVAKVWDIHNPRFLNVLNTQKKKHQAL
jgi:hypothetical protein